MSRKKNKKSSKKKAEEIVVAEEAAVEETPAEESAVEAASDDEGNVIEMAGAEGLNLEFADDESSASDDEGVDIDEVLSASDEEHVEGEISADTSSEEETMEASAEEETEEAGEDLSETELGDFESAEIEDVEVLVAEQVRSVVESVLFSTDKPLSIAVIKQAFKGTNVKSKDIREALTFLNEEYSGSARGFSLEEISGGFQLRTKADNMKYLRQSVKARPFKLSGPALEVMSIVAYKQPVTKAQMDEIRGVESGHLLRALMEKHLVTFGERSDLPGKPMFYETTRKFLEIFGLRNLQELPSLAEIDQLIPEGIGEEKEKEKLSDLTGQLSTEVGTGSYSEAEDELLKITDELTTISTSSDFFEQEKQRMREKRDQDRAQSIREAMLVGETVEDKDRRWLERYEKSLLEAQAANDEVAFVAEGVEGEVGEGAEASEGVEAAESAESEVAVASAEPEDDGTISEEGIAAAAEDVEVGEGDFDDNEPSQEDDRPIEV